MVVVFGSEYTASFVFNDPDMMYFVVHWCFNTMLPMAVVNAVMSIGGVVALFDVLSFFMFCPFHVCPMLSKNICVTHVSQTYTLFVMNVRIYITTLTQCNIIIHATCNMIPALMYVT